MVSNIKPMGSQLPQGSQVSSSPVAQAQVSESLPANTVAVDQAVEKFVVALEADIAAGGGAFNIGTKVVSDAMADLYPILGQAAGVIGDAKGDGVGVAQVLANSLANIIRKWQGKI